MNDLVEVINARLKKNARMAYSVTWPALRTIRWIEERLASLVFGKSQRSNGPINRDVFMEENPAVEKIEMNTIQRTTGP
jgi:hypothetical protein